MHALYESQGSNSLLRAKAQPRSSKDEFAEALDNRLKMRITAPPIDGKANQHLIKFLARQFKANKSQIELLAGDATREKR